MTAITDEQRKQLENMSKPELVELLVLALEAQEKATENMRTTAGLLEAAGARIKELEGLNQTQEAELIVLRAK